MNRIAKLFAVLALISAPCILRGADIPVFPTGAVYKFQNGLAWGAGTTAFNNNFFFTPLSLNESVCVYVKNNNPTSAHTFTSSISITFDPNNATPSDGTWNNIGGNSGIAVLAAPSQPSIIAATISGASQVSINFSASSTAGGSPDTATISIVQTQGNCLGGNGSANQVNITQQGVAAIQPIQVYSEGLSQSFYTTNTAQNPTANQIVLNVNSNSGGRTLYFQRIILSSTVAVTLNINVTTTVGTGCSALLAFSMKPGGVIGTSTSVANQGCTGAPASGNGFPVILGANSSIVIDLSGFVQVGAVSGQNLGIDLSSAAVTGTVSAAIFWYEK